MAGAGGLPPYKIALKSTTKISLNDRFSTLRKQGDPASSLQTIRQRMQQVRQASARNRRLAQQMENRPSVIAALKLKKKSLTLKQRLGVGQNGSGIKARLSLGGRGMGQFRGNRGIGRGRGQGGRGGSPRRGLRGAGRSRPYVVRGRGISPLIRTRLGNQTSFPNRRGNRGKISPGRSRRGRGFVSRGGIQFGNRGVVASGSGWQPRGHFRGNQQGGNFRGGSGNFRGGRRRQQQRGGGRGGGRGRGSVGMSGRNQQNKNVTPATKQELDAQLEDYMSRTKSHLDAELDAYMAEAAAE